MPDYRTPLPRVFAGSLQAAVNRVLDLDPAAGKHLERLEGKVLALEIDGLGIVLYLTSRYGVVHIGVEGDGEPDATVRGTPFALFSMAAPGEAEHWDEAGSGVHISGDARLARELEQVFRNLDPDWEGQLAAMFGDVLGFQLASGLGKGVEFLRRAANQTAEMTGRYMRGEAASLLRPEEFQAFGEEVRHLAEELDELEAQLQRMQDRAE